MRHLAYILTIMGDPAVERGYDLGYKVGSFLKHVLPYILIVVVIILLYQHFKKKE